MKKIALFLGAGASAPYGMPTTKDFLDKLGRDFPRRDLLEHGQYHDIEHILLILDQTIRFAKQEAGKYHCQIDSDFRDKAEKSKKAKKIIERLVRSHYKWSPSNNPVAEKILTTLIDLAKSDDQRATVFTTNYDTAIESYCEKADRKIDRIDGFKYNNTAKQNIWEENFRSNDDGLPTKVYLYKLHGSISWQEVEVDGKTAIVQKPDGSTPDRRSRDMYIRPSLDVKSEATHEEPYKSLFSNFKDELQSFRVCVVIGYSFRDKHILKEFIKFIKDGNILIAVSPTSAADFWDALKKQPPSYKMDKWNKKELYSMSYRPGDKAGFYAVRQKLDKSSMDTILDTITGIINNKRSADSMGSIVEATD